MNKNSKLLLCLTFGYNFFLLLMFLFNKNLRISIAVSSVIIICKYYIAANMNKPWILCAKLFEKMASSSWKYTCYYQNDSILFLITHFVQVSIIILFCLGQLPLTLHACGFPSVEIQSHFILQIILLNIVYTNYVFHLFNNWRVLLNVITMLLYSRCVWTINVTLKKNLNLKILNFNSLTQYATHTETNKFNKINFWRVYNIMFDDGLLSCSVFCMIDITMHKYIYIYFLTV